MATKFRLLLLDANVVIRAHIEGVWTQLIDRCEICLAQTVIDECQFYDGKDGNRYEIDLQADPHDGLRHLLPKWSTVRNERSRLPDL